MKKDMSYLLCAILIMSASALSFPDLIKEKAVVIFSEGRAEDLPTAVCVKGNRVSVAPGVVGKVFF